MKINKTVATVLLTVIVLAVLAAAGYAIYRLGYTHGLTTTSGDFMRDRFFHDFGGRFPHGMRRGGFGMRQPFYGLSLLRVVPGFLLFVGVVALVVIAVNSMQNKTRKSEPHEGDSKEPRT
jgi:hypothetical protein